jgi:hypothetical protein
MKIHTGPTGVLAGVLKNNEIASSYWVIKLLGYFDSAVRFNNSIIHNLITLMAIFVAPNDRGGSLALKHII